MGQPDPPRPTLFTQARRPGWRPGLTRRGAASAGAWHSAGSSRPPATPGRSAPACCASCCAACARSVSPISSRRVAADRSLVVAPWMLPAAASSSARVCRLNALTFSTSVHHLRVERAHAARAEVEHRIAARLRPGRAAVRPGHVIGQRDVGDAEHARGARRHDQLQQQRGRPVGLQVAEVEHDSAILDGHVAQRADRRADAVRPP